MLLELKKDIQSVSEFKKAQFLLGFFKTKEGQYGHGDVFLGITVPNCRKIAIKYKDLPFSDIEELIKSKFHEERLIALLILVHNFKNGTKDERKKIFEYYLAHTEYINNWDLVDLSADKIVGEYLVDKPRFLLVQLAHSNKVWGRRIAIIATYAFIKRGEYKETFKISEILLYDTHDLIQKAVGWMLREMGKRCSEDTLKKFLNTYYKTMPRTMLRYAIERFPKPVRDNYLHGEI